MFLAAITGKTITSNFNTYTVEEHTVDLFKLTIVTDNFLSMSITKPGELSIIESPFVNSQGYHDLILSKVKYVKGTALIEVYKPTISGRPIFYHVNQKGEFFCSTHISILRKAGVTIEENDEVIPHRLAVVSYNSIGSKDKKLVTIAGAGHAEVMAVGREQYFTAISEFVFKER